MPLIAHVVAAADGAEPDIGWPRVSHSLRSLAGLAEEWSAVALEGWASVGWPEPGGAVGIVADRQGPAAFVHVVMVMRAEQVEVSRYVYET
jgi:hypothetical protein